MEMADVVFREMQEEYLDAVRDIYLHYVLHTTATFHARPLTREDMREIVFFENEKYKTFVIFREEELCGYVLLTQHKKREAYDTTAEVTVYLKPGCIGGGLGSLGLQHLEEYARKQGVHVLVATICGENEKSIHLVERNGYFRCAHYKEVGLKFGQYLDIVGYQKILA